MSMDATVRRFVVGFCFSQDRQQVVLIRKKRPAWQLGLLNGPGGRCEEGETFVDAMAREYHEETGGRVAPSEWELLCTLSGSGPMGPVEVAFFRAFSDAGIEDAHTVTDEGVMVFETFMVHAERTIPNLQWLIPLAVQDEVLLPFSMVFK